MLRYYGWFGEPVADSPLESWRVRRVQLLLYLEDETMQVTEPAAPNSGIMQVGCAGCVVRGVVMRGPRLCHVPATLLWVPVLAGHAGAATQASQGGWRLPGCS